jgi:predicted lipid-binding transport protein (Tim44 family)
MSRRTCQILYVVAGVLVMTGMPLGLLLGGALGNLSALSLITLGLMVASAAIYFDVSSRSQRAADGDDHPPDGRAARAARRARAEAQRRRAERSLALERERERQRESHDALARRASERGHVGHQVPARRRPGPGRPRRRP